MEKLSSQAAAETRLEWQELGFFYNIDEVSEKWHLYGSLAGLMRLSEELSIFLDRKECIGEHEHLLPHWYLTIQYEDAADISKRGIVGTKDDLRRLKEYLMNLSQTLSVGDIAEIHSCFLNTSYQMLYHVKEDDFDPSSMDPQL